MDVSVATVSRAVSRLEDRLGGRLSNRSSRGVALTDFGRGLADQAARVYADAQEIECVVAVETSRHPRGRVRLTVPMSFGTRWVAPILPGWSLVGRSADLAGLVAERGSQWIVVCGDVASESSIAGLGPPRLAILVQ
jgi:hypothetical protein